MRYGDAGPGPKGSVMGATFQLDGQEFFALNGGPQFKFTEAISLIVRCETQEEELHSHSITRSARTWIDCGIARPSALAVVVLITSSNRLGCCTGRSAGFAPRRILST
jgi:hypothetical protein